ncbi:hypothetical protein [Limosilactobacillus reuteri]|uniref:hypothetical protein n=1 Tax=Limosilactobacillus reuteri TaxID=1598 RepID=UPI001E5FCAE0|nr:hypothetical protein [Limosilactobacillus reuteri]MCC4380474.1 hypothetical protein [Limosilactobacillus reuteri]
MKIKEALNFINATMTLRAKVDDDIMYVYEKSLGDDDWFMGISLYQVGWSAISADFDTCLDDDVDVMDLARVMDVVQRLICTPVNERFPEKKYRLRWINDDESGFPNYLCRNQGGEWWFTGTTYFTESELEQLKKDNPRLAPAIDAMKEPAEDKDDE